MLLTWPDEAATAAFGQRLAQALQAQDQGATLALEGELGTGKTTLARALIRALGHTGPVVSPTYTLVEPYAVAGRQLFHVDLYRVADPAELDYLGLREADPHRDWLLVEWYARSGGGLPPPDLSVRLAYAQTGRTAVCAAAGGLGQALLARATATNATRG